MFKSYTQRPRADFVPCFFGTFLRAIKSLIRTYFLQENIVEFFKLRNPKVGIDILSDFFLIFSYLKHLRAFDFQT
jgi:hypothetical protein